MPTVWALRMLRANAVFQRCKVMEINGPTPDESAGDPSSRFSPLGHFHGGFQFDASLPLVPDTGAIIFQRLSELLGSSPDVTEEAQEGWEQAAIKCIARNAKAIFPYLGDEVDTINFNRVGSFIDANGDLQMLISTGPFEAREPLLHPAGQIDRPQGFSGILVTACLVEPEDELPRFHRVTLVLDQVAYDYQLAMALAGKPSALSGWVKLNYANQTRGDICLETFIPPQIHVSGAPARFLALDQHGGKYWVGWEYDPEVGLVHRCRVTPLVQSQGEQNQESAPVDEADGYSQINLSSLLLSKAIARIQATGQVSSTTVPKQAEISLTEATLRALRVELRESIIGIIGRTAWDQLELVIDLKAVAIDPCTQQVHCVFTAEEPVNLSTYVALGPRAIIEDPLFCGYEARLSLSQLEAKQRGVVTVDPTFKQEIVSRIELMPILSLEKITRELDKLTNPDELQNSAFGHVISSKLDTLDSVIVAVSSSLDTELQLGKDSDTRFSWDCELGGSDGRQYFDIVCHTNAGIFLFELTRDGDSGIIGDLEFVGFWRALPSE